jgi:hypothetical protein
LPFVHVIVETGDVVVGIDAGTGALVVDGEKVFPIGLSNGPPLTSQTPAGRNGLEEVAVNGVNFLRTGIQNWGLNTDAEIARHTDLHDKLRQKGLYCWLWLGTATNLPPPGGPPSSAEQLLAKLVTAFKNEPALLAYKGEDEPQHAGVSAEALKRGYTKLKSIDPDHPVVMIQAPTGPAAELTKYRPAFDITGVDIYPVSYPPGQHSDIPNKDINVIGDLARKMREAAGGKPFWMTLQIAWSGIVATQDRPDRVPRFPNLLQERFMAYEAIVNGARGLNFFGGHMTTVMNPADAASGWNWTFWRRVLRPVVSELASLDVQPALVAPDAAVQVKPKVATQQVELVTRQTATHVYVIAVRIGGTVTQIELTGLPRKNDGSQLTTGEVLAEYVQDPLPPPVGGTQVLRRVPVANGSFKDWFGPHDAHVYRFAL